MTYNIWQPMSRNEYGFLYIDIEDRFFLVYPYWLKNNEMVLR